MFGEYGVEYGGYIYIVTNSTYYAQINGNGTIGVWTSTTSMGWGSTLVAYNGYIYRIGGNNTPGVNYASINSNGSLGVLNTAISLPDSYLNNETAVEYGGYIYVMGGSVQNAGSSISTVDYSQIQGNGSLGQWVSVTSLPQALEQATSIEYGGYIYEIGGFVTGDSSFSSV